MRNRAAFHVRHVLAFGHNVSDKIPLPAGPPAPLGVNPWGWGWDRGCEAQTYWEGDRAPQSSSREAFLVIVAIPALVPRWHLFTPAF